MFHVKHRKKVKKISYFSQSIQAFSRYSVPGTVDLNTRIQKTAQALFDFQYPWYMETGKTEWEKLFIMQFWEREIAFDTMPLFKMKLQKLLTVRMPYYEKMAYAQNLIGNPFINQWQELQSDRNIAHDANENTNFNENVDSENNRNATENYENSNEKTGNVQSVKNADRDTVGNSKNEKTRNSENVSRETLENNDTENRKIDETGNGNTTDNSIVNRSENSENEETKQYNKNLDGIENSSSGEITNEKTGDIKNYHEHADSSNSNVENIHSFTDEHKKETQNLTENTDSDTQNLTSENPQINYAKKDYANSLERGQTDSNKYNTGTLDNDNDATTDSSKTNDFSENGTVDRSETNDSNVAKTNDLHGSKTINNNENSNESLTGKNEKTDSETVNKNSNSSNEKNVSDDLIKNGKKEGEKNENVNETENDTGSTTENVTEKTDENENSLENGTESGVKNDESEEKGNVKRDSFTGTEKNENTNDKLKNSSYGWNGSKSDEFLKYQDAIMNINQLLLNDCNELFIGIFPTPYMWDSEINIYDINGRGCFPFGM